MTAQLEELDRKNSSAERSVKGLREQLEESQVHVHSHTHTHTHTTHTHTHHTPVCLITSLSSLS